MAFMITETELSKRGSQVRQLMRPICRTAGGPAWRPVSSRGFYVIGTFTASSSGGVGPETKTGPTAANYRDWRFPTILNNFRGNYFERWESEDDRNWYLNRAYLQIYESTLPVGTEREFLCLHCDPNEPEDNAHSLYKKGPHLHIKAAESPIPRSHIALALGQLPDLIQSVDALTEAIEWSILMIREQFLDLFEEK